MRGMYSEPRVSQPAITRYRAPRGRAIDCSRIVRPCSALRARAARLRALLASIRAGAFALRQFRLALGRGLDVEALNRVVVCRGDGGWWGARSIGVTAHPVRAVALLVLQRAAVDDTGPPPRQPQGGDIFGGGDAGGPGGSRRRTPRGERMGVDGTSAGAPSDIFGGSGAFGQGGKPKAAVAATSSDMMRGNTQNMPPPQHNQMLNHQQTGARPGRFAANRGASTFSFG